jgi:signal transduction histidine kinase
VSDTGLGIDPVIMPRLFTRIANKMDLRLGLYISNAIIETHGGKMWAENNSNGIGATFSFTLPLGEESNNVFETDKIFNNVRILGSPMFNETPSP